MLARAVGWRSSRFPGRLACLRLLKRGPSLCRYNGDYLRFNPLPSKRLGVSGPAIYTGAPRWPATCEYLADSMPANARASNRAQSQNCRSELFPRNVYVGDAVEVVNRDGTVAFGVVTFSEVGPLFDMVSVDGLSQTCNVADVTFAMRQFAPPVSPKIDPDTIRLQLTRLLASSQLLIRSIEPYLEAVYAHLSVTDRARAVDLEDVVNRVAVLVKVEAPRFELALGVYLTMAYTSLSFVRLRSFPSPFAAVGTEVMDSINKVMLTLTKHELDLGTTELRSGSTHLSQIGTQMKTFLAHYAIWNDSRLERAVEAIVSRVFPDRTFVDGGGIATAIQSIVGSDFDIVSGTLGSIDSLAKMQLALDRDFASADARVPSIEALAISKDMAVSFDDAASRMSLHIPIIPARSTLGPANLLSVRGRSAAHRPLLPESLALQFGILPGQPRMVMTVSAEVDIDTGDWEPQSIFISTEKIIPQSASKYFDSNTHYGTERDLYGSQSMSSTATRLSQILASLPVVQSDYDAKLGSLDRYTSLYTLAGQWAATWASQNNLPLPFLTQASEKTYPQTPAPETPECLSEHPEIHEQIGTVYAPVARPFASSLAIISQRQLINPASQPARTLASGSPRPSLVSKINSLIWPAHQLASAVEDRYNRQRVLLALQTELQTTETYHIFRCTVLRPPVTSTARIAQSWCKELGITVEMIVLPNTTVYEGDQVLCTEILELDPLQGLFVLSM